MTQHMKQGGQIAIQGQNMNQGGGSHYGANNQVRRGYEEAASMNYINTIQQRMSKPKIHASGKPHHIGKANQGLHGAAAGHGEGGIHSAHHGIQHGAVGNDHKTVLDGTVQGHKRKYRPANGIYQPPLQPFKHLGQSAINQTINKVNELVMILFKQKMKSSDQQIIKLLKFFGIPIPRGNGVVLDTKVIKMPDFLHSVN